MEPSLYLTFHIVQLLSLSWFITACRADPLCAEIHCPLLEHHCNDDDGDDDDDEDDDGEEDCGKDVYDINFMLMLIMSKISVKMETVTYEWKCNFLSLYWKSGALQAPTSRLLPWGPSLDHAWHLASCPRHSTHVTPTNHTIPPEITQSITLAKCQIISRSQITP